MSKGVELGRQACQCPKFDTWICCPLPSIPAAPIDDNCCKARMKEVKGAGAGLP